MRDAVFVESGPAEDPRVGFACTLSLAKTGASICTHSGQWEPIPFVGPRGKMVAWIHQDFTWLLQPDPQGG